MAKRITIVCAALIVAVLGLLIVRTPNVHVEYEAGKVVVHVETLGEYPTTITRIRLVDLESKTDVLDLVQEYGTPQLFNFTISAGINPVSMIHPYHGTYRVLQPLGAKSFILELHRKYKLTIWGDWSLPAQTVFVLDH